MFYETWFCVSDILILFNIVSQWKLYQNIMLKNQREKKFKKSEQSDQPFCIKEALVIAEWITGHSQQRNNVWKIATSGCRSYGCCRNIDKTTEYLSVMQLKILEHLTVMQFLSSYKGKMQNLKILYITVIYKIP